MCLHEVGGSKLATVRYLRKERCVQNMSRFNSGIAFLIVLAILYYQLQCQGPSCSTCQRRVVNGVKHF